MGPPPPPSCLCVHHQHGLWPWIEASPVGDSDCDPNQLIGVGKEASIDGAPVKVKLDEHWRHPVQGPVVSSHSPWCIHCQVECDSGVLLALELAKGVVYEIAQGVKHLQLRGVGSNRRGMGKDDKCMGRGIGNMHCHPGQAKSKLL